MSDHLRTQLEESVSWSNVEPIKTTNGWRNLRFAKPTQKFWSMWGVCKDQLVGMGVVLVDRGEDKHGKKKWAVKWWSMPTADELAKLTGSIAQSNSVDPLTNILVPVPRGQVARPYQVGAVAYAKDREGTLLADEMGLGKTIEAILVANYMATWDRIIVVCPASLKINWYRELRTWLVRDCVVAIADGQTFPVADVVVINYEILERHAEIFGNKLWDIAIADEAHYIKNPKAKRTIAFKKIKAKIRLAATGTPIESKLMDLFEVINWLDPKSFDNRYRFAARWCGGVKGSRVLKHKENDLQGVLRRTVMIRRMKADVLTELPPKQRQIIEYDPGQQQIDLTPEPGMEQKLIQLKVAVELAKVSNTLNQYERAVAELNHTIDHSLAEMAELRRRAAEIKLPFVLELIEQHIHQHKVAVFSWHRFMTEAIHHAYPNICVKHYGGMTTSDKQMSVDRFQNEEHIKLWAASLINAEGYTITAASHAILTEYDWRPGKMAQAEDRLHRIGQLNSVMIYYVVLANSIDAYMARDQVNKLRMIDAAVNPEEKKLIESEGIAPIKQPPVTVNVARVDYWASRITQTQINSINAGLRGISSITDLGIADAMIVRALLSSGTITARQAVLGARLVKRYQRYLPEDLVDACRYEKVKA